LMDQAVQVYAGTAERGSAVPTPSAGMVAYSTATGLQVFDGSAWTDVGGVGYGEATGGASTATISVGGESYTLLTFTSDDNLVVATAGLFDVLLVGGGASGAGCSVGGGGFVYSGGGGGAGAVSGLTVLNTIFLAAGTVAVDIGAGGAGVSNSAGSSGLSSSIQQLSAIGGGMGGGRALTSGHGATGLDGGSGGGCANSNTTVGIALNPSQGNNGGTSAAFNACGGGGGAGAVGANAAGTTGGAGGAGVEINTWIGGASFFVGGGGGGAGVTAGSGGSGGGGSARPLGPRITTVASPNATAACPDTNPRPVACSRSTASSR
jgi:hypothetical protein